MGIEVPLQGEWENERPDNIQGRLVAVVADFSNVDDVLAAAAAIRDANYLYWDVHTPMPIHGMNSAMGLRPTILPWITLVHGILGCILGLAMCWWINASTVSGVPTNAQGYQFIISGKPIFSLPANIPVVFEMTVLFAAIGTLLGLMGLNKLPMLSYPLQSSQRLLRATNDRFVVVINADNPNFSVDQTIDFIRSLKPMGIELVIQPIDK